MRALLPCLVCFIVGVPLIVGKKKNINQDNTSTKKKEKKNPWTSQFKSLDRGDEGKETEQEGQTKGGREEERRKEERCFYRSENITRGFSLSA